MTARQFFRSGVGVLLGGAVVILATLYFAEGVDRPILRQPLAIWSAYAVGVLLVLIGLLRIVTRAPINEARRDRSVEENDLVVSLRIWLIAAAADGRLHDKEVEVIRLCATRYFDLDLDDAFIRKTYAKLRMRTTERAIDEELMASELPLSADGIRKALLGAIYVTLFDGALDADERRVIDRIAARFELEPAVIDGLIDEVRADIARGV